MPPRNRRLPVVGGALGAILLLVLVALIPGSASAAAPTPNAAGHTTQQTVSYSKVYYGQANSRPSRAPDVLVLPSPPDGTWWQMTEAKLTLHVNSAKSFREDAFLFDRTVQNPTKYPGLADPNLDSLAHAGLDARKTGTRVGAGGTGSAPSGVQEWMRYTQPICLNSEIQIVLGAIIGVGNSVDVNVQYSVLGAGTTIVEYGHPQLNGNSVTIQVTASAGHKWYLMNAFADIQAGSTASRSVVIKTSAGTTLLSGSDFPKGVLVRDTGGYSTKQTGPALNKYGTETVWASQYWLSGSEFITVKFTGPAPAQTMWVLVFTQE